MAADLARPGSPDAAVPQLSWRSFGVALAVTLAIFYLLHPMWRPMDMDDMDRNIAWSYAPIPLLVLVLLALERKLRWASWLLETIRLTLVKFAITFLFANVVWLFVGPPGLHASPRALAATSTRPGRFEVRAAPPATRLDASRAGRVDGVVTDSSGAPQADVLVSVTGGLDGIVFAPRADGVSLAHDGDALRPARAVALTFEPVVLRGASDRLHSVRATDARGLSLFNLALVPGSESTLMFDRPLGLVKLACAVHGDREPTADLAVVANPFAAWTGPDGRFSFEGVPAGALELTAMRLSGPKASAQVVLAPGGAVEGARLSLP